MLDDAPKGADRPESMREASIIAAELLPLFGARAARPVAAPPFAGRVSYDRKRPPILPGVSLDIPDEHIGQVGVGAFCFNK